MLGRAYMLQTMARFYSGDLPGAEHYFVGGLEFFENPSFTRVPGVAVTAFNHGSMNAWVTGHADVARERMARMMAAANDKNAYDRALAGKFQANSKFGWDVSSKPKPPHRGCLSFPKSIIFRRWQRPLAVFSGSRECVYTARPMVSL